MEIKNDQWFRNSVRAALLSCVVGCLSLTVQAAGVPATKNTVLKSPAGAGKDTVQIGNVICRVGPCGSDIIDQAINQHPTIELDGGQPKISGGGKMNNPSGNPIKVNTSGRLAGPAIRDVIKKALPKLLDKVPFLGLGIAIWEVGKEIGYILTKGPGGDLVVAKETTTNEWTSQAYWGATKYRASTLAGACAAAGEPSPTGNYCTRDNGNTAHIPTPVAGTTQTVSAPSTEQEFLDAVAAKSGWPATSKLAPLIGEATAANGEGVEVIPASVTTTGPATSPGTTTTTTNSGNNTTTTTNTTHNHTYNGGNVTTSTTSITNITNNTTGDTISSSTTTSTPAPEEKASDPCKDAPDRASCADMDVPEGEIPKETRTISYTEESVFGSGSCPANLTAHISTLGQTVTVWNWTKTCDYALPLRGLILALATFAAALIVMPGRAEV